jgi:hypothetical protein
MKMALYGALVVIIVVGFYMVLGDINDIQVEVERLGLLLRLDDEQSGLDREVVSEGNVTVVDDEAILPSEEGITIPTAIIFSTRSDVRLLPQANISIVVEGVSLNTEDEMTVHLKAFTNEANSYSAVDAGRMFEIVNLGGANVRPLSIAGKFDSMPPKSVIRGGVLFDVSSPRERVILQVNTGRDVVHYEFDFVRKNYREAVLG